MCPQIKSISCCFTEHRPEKLKAGEEEIKSALSKEIRLAVMSGIRNFHTGMARGVDLWAAEIVLELKKDFPQLRLICAIPYRDFEKSGLPAGRNSTILFYPKQTKSITFIPISITAPFRKETVGWQTIPACLSPFITEKKAGPATPLPMRKNRVLKSV